MIVDKESGANILTKCDHSKAVQVLTRKLKRAPLGTTIEIFIRYEEDDSDLMTFTRVKGGWEDANEKFENPDDCIDESLSVAILITIATSVKVIKGKLNWKLGGKYDLF